MNLTFGIAFGGGGARGLAHIHVIEALDELGIRPVAIAGSSIGAIMGAGMASGMTGKDIHDYARSILGRRAEVASRMWRARPGTIAEAMQAGIRVSQFNVERILKAFLPEAIPETFAELKIPLKVTATDYFGHKLAVFAEGDLHSALAASAAIPAVFRPVMRDGRLLIDGGIYNPVPFDLIEDDADIIIGVDVVGAPEEADHRRPTSVDLMFGATQLMMQSIIANKLKQCQPDILIRPAVSKYRVLDFLKIEVLMTETADIKDQLKREVERVVEARESAAVEQRRGKQTG
ncbi:MULTISPECIES: patatin-like phospholipase family protein [unclassified Mesorhizobium]|uniref:patatin-like phospholipase family protein n=1 Tax=unclassified Mesorhizobium TaxID=325217 RepID=UPI00112E7456|nr:MULTISPECIES: patatin-like phospholipase family protein [unclassified Mesorhizobium]MBZ9703983.1 patatin-like phospholipase family protein [Mesorhizobium sp. CO1-1-3]MBZ9949537.1 patatin-like phospholipase family protein [Mesorhizobium sp. BR1-1-11]MBZ9959921.1 patatin-like phospholipase family protein [Mesorhizobium sp. BR1-1-14]MCA0023197.1 patatin-like phospholipase family protein [Mesorhizobium sp. B263B1A]MCA0060254.1 patatin-like phospholipase family protein [Mesorhizobium sp. B261B1A